MNLRATRIFCCLLRKGKSRLLRNGRSRVRKGSNSVTESVTTKLLATQQHVWAQEQWGSLRRQRRTETRLGDPRLMDCDSLQLGEESSPTSSPRAPAWLGAIALIKQLLLHAVMARETRLTIPLERAIRAIHANSLATLNVFIPVSALCFSHLPEMLFLEASQTLYPTEAGKATC